MNELTKNVNVQYTLPEITVDFAELGNEIGALETQYANWVVQANDIPIAKKSVATFNKIVKAIDDKRIEIKKIISAPIAQMETDLKALTARITAIADNIKKQTDDFEVKRKEVRKAEILALPEWVGEYMTFDEKWLNATTTDKTILDNLAAQKQFFTNNALLISTTCNAKGLSGSKYLEMLANHKEVADIVLMIENDAKVKAEYANLNVPQAQETVVESVEIESDIYELTLHLTATKGQLTALKAFIEKLGIKYETVE